MPVPLIDPLSDSQQKLIQRILALFEVTPARWEALRASPAISAYLWPGSTWNPAQPPDLAPYIDHTLLKPEATQAQILELCAEALTYNFATVCVNSSHLRTCADRLKGAEVALCSVIGFPLGAMATEVKAAETRYSIEQGADEIDMVIALGPLKAAMQELLFAREDMRSAGELSHVFSDIKSVVDAADGKCVKAILETGLLNEDEIVVASTIAILAGAKFIKTSTGFGPGGATLNAVNLMRRVAGPHIGVKASGGIRDTETAIQMIQAGANRLGTSSGKAIIGKA